jgi:Uma2 family endonuclease
MVTTGLLTAEDLEAMGAEAEKRYELIDGMLHEVEGVGGRHGDIEFGLGVDLGAYNRRYRVGKFFTSDTRFIIGREPDIVLMPDIAFVRADHIPATGVWEGMVPIAPDLVVEIASPNDTGAKVREKATRWLDVGVEIVWVLWPKRRAVSILRSGQPEVILTADDVLDGGSLLPGFRLPVAAIFAE